MKVRRHPPSPPPLSPTLAPTLGSCTNPRHTCRLFLPSMGSGSHRRRPMAARLARQAWRYVPYAWCGVVWCAWRRAYAPACLHVHAQLMGASPPRAVHPPPAPSHAPMQLPCATLPRPPTAPPPASTPTPHPHPRLGIAAAVLLNTTTKPPPPNHHHLHHLAAGGRLPGAAAGRLSHAAVRVRAAGGAWLRLPAPGWVAGRGGRAGGRGRRGEGRSGWGWAACARRVCLLALCCCAQAPAWRGGGHASDAKQWHLAAPSGNCSAATRQAHHQHG